MKTRTSRRISRALPAAVLAMSLAGCMHPLGWLATKLLPPKKIPAQHTLAKKRVLVLVKAPAGGVENETLKSDLTERLYHILTTQKLVSGTVPYEKLTVLRSETPDYHDLTGDEIAARLGAELLIEVHVDRLALGADSHSRGWQGRFDASVCVRDPVARSQHWPAAGTQAVDPVILKTRSRDVGGSQRHTVDQLVAQMADRIGKLFYSCRPEHW